MIVKTEKEIIKRIIEIESQYDPEDDFSYLDEGQQAELSALYWVLDKELPSDAKKEIANNRDLLY